MKHFPDESGKQQAFSFGFPVVSRLNFSPESDGNKPVKFDYRSLKIIVLYSRASSRARSLLISDPNVSSWYRVYGLVAYSLCLVKLIEILLKQNLPSNRIENRILKIIRQINRNSIYGCIYRAHIEESLLVDKRAAFDLLV